MPPRRFSNFKIKNLPQRRKGLAEKTQRAFKTIRWVLCVSSAPQRLCGEALRF